MEQKEITVPVTTMTPQQKTGKRMVTEYTSKTEMITENYSEMVPYTETIQVPAQGCDNQWGANHGGCDDQWNQGSWDHCSDGCGSSKGRFGGRMGGRKGGCR